MWRNVEEMKKGILPIIMAAKSIIVFDTETTGLKEDAKIIQFSAVRYEIDEKYHLHQTNILDLYINPEEPISDFITNLTGITNEMVKNAKTEREVCKKIFDFLYSADVWAAYNSPFDIRMLKQMTNRIGVSFQEPDVIDILKIARVLYPGKTIVENHKLETISKQLFPDLSIQYHSAIEDTKISGKVLDSFIQMLLEFNYDSENKIPAKLEYAYFVQNPRRKSEKRIKLKLSICEFGDIFWDVINKCWGSKKNNKSKVTCEILNMPSIEQQLLNMYGFRYHAYDIETLAYNWEKEYIKKEKEKKKK